MKKKAKKNIQDSTTLFQLLEQFISPFHNIQYNSFRFLLPRQRVDIADQMIFSCEKHITPSLPPRISGSFITPLSIISLLYFRQIFNLKSKRVKKKTLKFSP